MNTQPSLSSLILAALLVVLAACSSAPDASSAAKNVETYLQARTKSNVEQMISLSCSAWEPTARIEATSFQSMEAKLDGVACTTAGSEGSSATVMCTGKIVTSYNGESRDWRLDQRPFVSALEGGEWRMCGYK
jgi:hypothetical protein